MKFIIHEAAETKIIYAGLYIKASENGWDITFVGIWQGLLIQSCKWVLDVYPMTQSPQIMWCKVYVTAAVH